MQGTKSDKEALMDITVSTPTLFKTLQRNPPQLAIAGHGDGELWLKGYGAPTPANILTVSIVNLPSQAEEASLGKPYTKHTLNIYRPEDIPIYNLVVEYYAGLDNFIRWESGLRRRPMYSVRV